ncbi:hypothetical protein [Actinoplanes sp. NPDC051851]|uniref:putative quinol monooxygenase n=1 Tax=Actinoplanes sp. NPDC051851 TaxID=3154753 RepID=UPI003426357B
MSVVMVLRLKANPRALEEFATGNPGVMDGIAEAGKALGCVRHTFAANGDDEIVVVDEWADEDAFHKFFESQPDVHRLMEAAGAQAPPEVAFYRRIETPGQF